MSGSPRPSLFQFAGGQPAFLALAAAHHARCLADPELNHPFSHDDQHPQHVQRLAAYWAEVMGGPPAYSQSCGDQTGVLQMHAGNGDMGDLGQRFLRCFDLAADDAGLPGDPAFRAALHAYMRWAVDDVLVYSPRNTVVAAGAAMPRWGWDGPERDPDSWWLDEASRAGREHFDEQHARRYDAKMDAQSAAEVRLLQAAGALGAGSSVVDLGAGSGQFALAAAQVCERVVAVDVSPVMLAQLTGKLAGGAAGNVEVICAGFLTYEHAGRPADLVYSRFALHHLPDFWKAIALRRIAGMLRPGGVLRLWDVVYSFEPADTERRLEAWIADDADTDVERGWTRAEFAEHIRDEHSTFTWLLEPMIERAGFELTDASYDPSGVLARYVCTRR